MSITLNQYGIKLVLGPLLISMGRMFGDVMAMVLFRNRKHRRVVNHVREFKRKEKAKICGSKR